MVAGEVIPSFQLSLGHFREPLIKTIVKLGNLELASLLFDKGMRLTENEINDYYFEFAKKGNVGMVSLLLDKGANVNNANAGDINRTALHYAAWKGRFEVVKLLVERGALIDPTDRDERTPLAMAMCIIPLGHTQKDEYEGCDGHVEIVRYLLQKGANAQARRVDSSGYFIDKRIKRLIRDNVR